MLNKEASPHSICIAAYGVSEPPLEQSTKANFILMNPYSFISLPARMWRANYLRLDAPLDIQTRTILLPSRAGCGTSAERSCGDGSGLSLQIRHLFVLRPSSFLSTRLHMIGYYLKPS
jgi:hypothetical protein